MFLFWVDIVWTEGIQISEFRGKKTHRLHSQGFFSFQGGDGISETLASTYESTQCRKPKEQHRQLHLRDNLKSHTLKCNLSFVCFYSGVFSTPWIFAMS